MKFFLNILVILGVFLNTQGYSQYFLGGPGDGYASDTSAFYKLCYAPEIVAQSSDSSTCQGNPIFFFASFQNSPTEYQWQENNGTDWVSISDNGNYSGTTNDTLFILSAEMQFNENYYRCIATNVCGSDTSNPMQIKVFQTFIDTAEVYICFGDTISVNGHFYSSTGTYIDSMISANGCDSIIITHLTVYSLPQITISKIDALCYGGMNGSAVVNFSGGIMPYTCKWSNGSVSPDIYNLSAGAYSVTVTDAAACSSSASTIIEEPSQITIFTSTVPAECDSSDGVAAAFATGGTSPYTLQWSTGDSTSIVQNLSANSYTLTVTDANLCEKYTVVNINNSSSLDITIQNIANVSCFNGSDGAINISVSGGNPPYSYEWSNGAITQNISGIMAGIYNVSVTDNTGCIISENIEITQPDALTISAITTPANCGTNNGTAEVAVTGGTQPYSYLWSTGNTTVSVSGLTAGNYSIVVSDFNGCVKTNSIAVSNDSGPVISSASISNASCSSNNGSIDITVSSSSMPLTFNWSDSSTSEDLQGISAGDYSLTVTDNSGCVTAGNYTVMPQLPLENSLCIVLVDSILNKNKIVWEKVQSTGIDHYNIYKETTTSGAYQLLANIPFNSLSEYIDPYANPVTRPWRYKLSAVDSCGNESPLSEAHKTLHLTVNQGQNQTVNLIWDKYEGFPYFSYYVYRHIDTGGWQILDTIPSTVWTYVDNPGTDGKVIYVVTVEKGDSCISTGLDKTSGGPYSHSISNIDETIIPNGIPKIMKELAGDIKIYPNPANNNFTIEFRNNLSTKYCLNIYNITGELIHKQENIKTNKVSIDSSTFKSGFYSIELKGQNILRTKLIIRK